MKTSFRYTLLGVCLSCVLTPMITHAETPDLNYPCGTPERINEVDNRDDNKAMRLFLEQAIAYHKIDLSQPFQQKKMNFVFKSMTRLHQGSYQLVTRQGIYQTNCTGKFDHQYGASVADNCTVLIDEKDDTLLRCYKKSLGENIFYRFQNLDTKPKYYVLRAKSDDWDLADKKFLFPSNFFESDFPVDLTLKETVDARPHQQLAQDFKEKITQHFKPDANFSFKAKQLNSVLMAKDTDWYGKYLLITKDKIFQTDETGVFDEKTNPYATDCRLIVDTPKNTEFECSLETDKKIWLGFHQKKGQDYLSMVYAVFDKESRKMLYENMYIGRSFAPIYMK